MSNQVNRTFSVLELLNIPAVSSTILGTGSVVAAMEVLSAGAFSVTAGSILFPVLGPAAIITGALGIGTLIKKKSGTVNHKSEEKRYKVAGTDNLTPGPKQTETLPSDTIPSAPVMEEESDSNLESVPDKSVEITEKTNETLIMNAMQEFDLIKTQEIIDMLKSAEMHTETYKPFKNHSEYTKKLRSILSERRILNKELSARVGVTESFLSKITNGHKLPGRNTSIAICIALDLGIEKAIELLSLSGHALSNAMPRDKVILLCLHEHSSVDMTDEALTLKGFPGLLKLSDNGAAMSRI